MVYKIGNIGDVREFPYLPKRMLRTVRGLASILTNLYGEDRDVDNGDGGFILYAEPGTTEEELKDCFDYTNHTVEFISVESEYPMCIAEYVLNNEFAVTIIMWTEDLPPEMRRELEEDSNGENNRGIAAIIIERDYKGIYERFALTPEEFRQEYPEVFEDKPDDYTVSAPDSCTIAPLVHIWYRECYVGDRMWSKFFTDMTWGLPTIDTDAGNIAHIRRDMMKSLLEYLPDTGERYPMKYKIRISETLSRVIDVDARCETEAIDIAMRRYQTTELVLDTTDMYEVNFENVEDNEK